MTTEFDRVFNQMEAPEYPATCDNCGYEATNAEVDQHICSDAPTAPKRGEQWIYGHYAGRAKGFYVNRVHPDDSDLQTRVADIKYHEDDERNEAEIRARQIVTEHNQHSTLIAQRERLIDAIRDIAIRSLLYCEQKYDHDDQARLNLEALLESVLTTIEQEGTTRQ